MGTEADAPTVFDAYLKSNATAHIEFGVPGPASADRLREIIPENDIWPVRRNGSWVAHHAFGAWPASDSNGWLYPEVAEHYFGPSGSLEQLVARLQLLQAEGYKAIYEEGRRKKPACSALTCWVFNEPWPTAANNSLVSWPNDPKPAYHAVAAANRPTMASARIPRFDWKRGGQFTADLFLLHDGPHPAPSCEIRAFLDSGTHCVEIARWTCPGAAANTHVVGPGARGIVPSGTGQTFNLMIEVDDYPQWNSTYTLAYAR
jgi:beta-mannosidase